MLRLLQFLKHQVRDIDEEANNLKCNVPLSESQTNEQRTAADTW